MDISLLVEFINFDPDTGCILVKANFLEPEIQRVIERAVVDKRRTRMDFNLKFHQTNKRRYQDCWYGSLKQIAKSDQYRLSLTAENMEVLDEYMRKSIFPSVTKRLEGTDIPFVARMRHLSDEDLQKCIDTLHDRYSYLTINGLPIDFSDLKS